MKKIILLTVSLFTLLISSQTFACTCIEYYERKEKECKNTSLHSTKWLWPLTENC